MRSAGRSKRRVRVEPWARAALAVAAAFCSARPAAALEAFDGALQLHGFFEVQTRVLARDFDPEDGYHLAQWYNILNLEVEWDTAPQGWGPFDLISTFLRVEVRYDCVWTGGCYTLRGLTDYRDRYGDQAERLPKRLSDGRVSGLIGVIDPDEFADKRNLIQIPLGELADPYGAPAGLGEPAPNQRHLGFFWNEPALNTLFFAGAGPDRIWGTGDDPGLYVGERFRDYRFALKKLPGPEGGISTQVLGPYRPRDPIPGPAPLRDRPNPFRGPCPEPYDPSTSPELCDLRPSLKSYPDDPASPETGEFGGMSPLPFRPVSENPYVTDDPGINSDAVLASLDQAQGLYVPNAGFRRLLEEENFEYAPDQNFTESELSWNHGASQDIWRELKELYVDLEMFDHHLWLRLGRQTIVWGKTELFRAQDQFNPQDLGLASLPSLEESRVPLWSARGIWAFYDVGPLQDVRIELAINFDRFYPADLGRCGEPFAPRSSCTIARGFFANSLVGTGIGGEFRYGYPWQDPQSLEGGARLEFRHDRVSYAITYFNGLEDLPYAEPDFVFERNVDPFTGRPRRAGSRAPCDPKGLLGDHHISGCLGQYEAVTDGGGNVIDYSENFGTAESMKEVLAFHHANQQLFTTICAATITYSTLLLEGCGFNTWNSVAPSDPTNPLFPTLSMAFSAMLAGQGTQGAIDAGLGGIFKSMNGKMVMFAVGRFGPDDPATDEFEGLGVGCSSLIATPGEPPCDDPADLPFRDEDDMPLVPLVQDVNPGCNPITTVGCSGDINDGDLEFFNERLAARGVTNPGLWVFWHRIGVSQYLSDEQEALLGCGPFWGTHCDVDGFDIFLAEASGFFQSWPGFEGTEGGVWLTNDTSREQPGTVGFRGGPVCTRYVGGTPVKLPGCRGPEDLEEWGYEEAVDGTVPSAAQGNPMALTRDGVPGDCTVLPPGTPGCTPAFLGGHPFTGQPWQNEMAAVGWNALMAFVTLSAVAVEDDDGCISEGCDPGDPQFPGLANDGLNDAFQLKGLEGRFDEFNPRDPYNPNRCSYYNPTICKVVVSIIGVSGAGKNSVKAGGNPRFGRRDFLWHGGAQVVLDYQRRHVVGFAMDFAEDRSGSNWNLEFTWFHRVRLADNDAFDMTSKADLLNLTIGVDRPTFIRFLNKSRTFFFSGQLFMQYVVGYEDSLPSSGPFNVLMTVGAFTAYHQDRLVPGLQFVWDFPSASGALLWSFAYRITQSFLIQFGLSSFFGTVEAVETPLFAVGTAGVGGAGKGAYHGYVENGLSTVRHRDEIFLRLRYTF